MTPTRTDTHFAAFHRGRSLWGPLVAIAGVLLAALALTSRADVLVASSGSGAVIVGELSVSSGAQILTSSLICPASHPSVIYEIEVIPHANGGGDPVLVHEINYVGVTDAVPNGTGSPVEGSMNSGTALAEGKTYTFAVTGERIDQEGRLLSHNFSLVGTTPKVAYLVIRRREVSH